MIIIIGKKDRLLAIEINNRLKALAESINIDIKQKAAELAGKDVKVEVFGTGIYKPDGTVENEIDKAIAEEFDDLEDYNAISSNPTFFEEDRISLGRLDDLSS